MRSAIPVQIFEDDGFDWEAAVRESIGLPAKSLKCIFFFDPFHSLRLLQMESQNSRPLVMQQIEACHKIVGIWQEWTIDLTGQTCPSKRASRRD
ncbi:unnamed protein product [Microthlaspi erraticum]|uniref:Uncharacterized protein n=1 Tax=Microthlaspi erraticum TaxID=1685480 RepID=A0A6D2HT77_9BRAS|nr:unnamed protein product [Microthlaspi erraticum]